MFLCHRHQSLLTSSVFSKSDKFKPTLLHVTPSYNSSRRWTFRMSTPESKAALSTLRKAALSAELSSFWVQRGTCCSLLRKPKVLPVISSLFLLQRRRWDAFAGMERSSRKWCQGSSICSHSAQRSSTCYWRKTGLHGKTWTVKSPHLWPQSPNSL